MPLGRFQLLPDVRRGRHCVECVAVRHRHGRGHAHMAGPAQERFDVFQLLRARRHGVPGAVRHGVQKFGGAAIHDHGCRGSHRLLVGAMGHTRLVSNRSLPAKPAGPCGVGHGDAPVVADAVLSRCEDRARAARTGAGHSASIDRAVLGVRVCLHDALYACGAFHCHHRPRPAGPVRRPRHDIHARVRARAADVFFSGVEHVFAFRDNE
mmetsp:Transcript_92029/g.281634  ORF Transcript_92029/g.281634 Transcript_92029/m.281634 type:complete len:209 (-) Transcript_92029:906-1532(-)